MKAHSRRMTTEKARGEAFLHRFPEPPPKKGNWSESAVRVLRERYLARQGDKVLETPEGMCWRVAVEMASVEEKWGKGAEEIYEIAARFYELILDDFFLPNSPTLMNAGKQNGLQYSACYVLPVGDSMEEIFEAVKAAAIIHKSGGGTGFAFSRLRPQDATVRSTGGKASGPISFLRVFNGATEAVKQGGTRRGANMGILRVDHPDILEFIESKLDGGITNFNISVAITEKFMEALRQDKEYDLVAPHTKEVVGRLRAREVFDRIVQAAWRTGDPGLFLVDRCNAGRANPTPTLAEVEATNPCGEQPLYPNEACNLGSINLAKFFKVAGGNGKGTIDWDDLERVVRLSVRFLDDVIDANPYPLPEIDASVKANRRIGLGVMGWADLLFELGIPYDSEEALSLAGEVMRFIEEKGHDESARLAEERGPFPNWPRSIYQDERPLRNSTVTTIAPTGTISIIANCSSGIEPVFALAFSHIVGDRHLTFINPIFERMAKARGFYSEELMKAVAERGTVRGLAGIPEDVQRVFVTAHEIDTEWHVRMQAAFQKYTDNGVSKTINLPNAATEEDVEKAYLLAYELGCIGITVFRDGCKGEQVLHVGTKKKDEAKPTADVGIHIEPRPEVIPGKTYRIQTPVGTAFITVNDNGKGAGEPFEVFVSVGKAGSETMAHAEALGRLISLVLRLPLPKQMSAQDRVAEIVGQLSGIGGGRPLGFGRKRVLSLPDALAQALAQHVGLTEVTEHKRTDVALTKVGDLCPDCQQATLVNEEGCRKCYS
ncbi:MAG: vitamin B12-dependent ribonucleotide reductase, partial [Candidatus Methylomirabilales bacterium]